VATSVCQYATLAAAKALLGITNATDDALLQSLCDRWNGWIESKTGRVLGPIPDFDTTVTAGGGAGSSAVTLATVAGLAVGDALLFGPVAATHEHSVVVAIAGNVVSLQWPLVATYANGTAVARCQLFDGGDDGRTLVIDQGVIAVSSLEISPTPNAIGSVWYSIPSTDYFIWPRPFDREPGWPGMAIQLAAVPSGGNPFPTFTRYESSIRAVGLFGWPAIQDEVVSIALNLVIAGYRRRGASGGSQVTIGTDGQRTIEMALSSEDWRTLNRLTSKPVYLID
jgi:hypothetical protein